MHPLVNKIIHTLANPSSAEAREEALAMSALVFEKAGGSDPCDWHPELTDATFNQSDVAQLKQCLLEIADRDARGSYSLSKCHDVALKPTFIRILQRQLHGDPSELFQAMIALDNLGENIFQGATSMSILDEDMNRQLAKAYLDNLPAS